MYEPRPDSAINKFTSLILEDKEAPFYGDGSNCRDYTFVKDIVTGIVGSINCVDTDEKIFKIFNIGEDKTISLMEMVETIEEVLGKKAKLNRVPT